jgi:hypothetical protein
MRSVVGKMEVTVRMPEAAMESEKAETDAGAEPAQTCNKRT